MSPTKGYMGKHLKGIQSGGTNARGRHRGCIKKEIRTAKGIPCRHASAVTFSYHATRPVIHTCWVFMTDTCKKSVLGAEVIPKDAKNEKRPHNANIKVN